MLNVKSNYLKCIASECLSATVLCVIFLVKFACFSGALDSGHLLSAGLPLLWWCVLKADAQIGHAVDSGFHVCG